ARKRIATWSRNGTAIGIIESAGAGSQVDGGPVSPRRGLRAGTARQGQEKRCRHDSDFEISQHRLHDCGRACGAAVRRRDCVSWRAARGTKEDAVESKGAPASRNDGATATA